MSRIFTFLVLSLFIFQTLLANELEELLSGIPDITFEKTQTPKGFIEAYELRVRQPLDHKNPNKGYFEQKVYLTHMGLNNPTVFVTEGYSLDVFRPTELSYLLSANQVEVEHRYYGCSLPDSMDYRFLNLEQETADLHKISEMLKTIYKQSWISTGISKGGQTTIFYKYFFPDDMDAWIPYVAPFNLSLEDQRIYDFLDTIGSDECRHKIFEVQKRILTARDTILKVLKSYSEKENLKFTYLNFDEAFEYTVLEYPFSFWQWGNKCEDIPKVDGPLFDVFTHLFSISDIGFFSDGEMEAYGSHYYQAATEMGYYGYNIDKLKDYIKALPTDKNPLATFPPDKMQTEFSDSLVRVVYNWINEHGDNMVYIYGGTDTWSATAILPYENTNSIWFFIPGASHSAARIYNLSKQEIIQLAKTLEQWMGVKIKRRNIKKLTASLI
ncbi:MAG: hypothetical protein JXA77_17260 [Bacteroidales bacterium]|nr:hypothetical protein [Bacteroidales bacterium]MBN2818665.1 hypothetical protein [Bacteroidales bacterium]